jgi:hypothetical protein
MPEYIDSRKHLFANNASTTLAANIGVSQTQITVSAGGGAAFPSPGINEIFKITVVDYAQGIREIMHCTARTGDVLTVERGREDTTAQAFPAGASVQLRMTSGTLHYLQYLLGS